MTSIKNRNSADSIKIKGKKSLPFKKVCEFNNFGRQEEIDSPMDLSNQ